MTCGCPVCFDVAFPRDVHNHTESVAQQRNTVDQPSEPIIVKQPNATQIKLDQSCLAALVSLFV